MFQTHDNMPISLEFTMRNQLRKTMFILEYLLTKAGPLTSVSLDAMAFIKSGLRDDLKDAPDIQYHFVSARLTTDDQLIKKTYDWTTDFQRGVSLFALHMNYFINTFLSRLVSQCTPSTSSRRCCTPR